MGMPSMPPQGGDPMMGGDQNAPMPPMPPQGGDPMMGGGQEPPMPQDDDMGNQFGSNFDAGVEADEEEDPKRFIQQLTGKLSQSLNKYNNENEGDEELSKYVGKMIAKAAAKGLDEKGKKELIKSINTTESDTDESEGEMPEDNEMPDDMGNEGDAMPMNEGMKLFTKNDIRKLAECFGEVCMGQDNDKQSNPDKKKSHKISKTTPFTPKKFNQFK